MPLLEACSIGDISISKLSVVGFGHAIRGMRNSFDSHGLSDSYFAGEHFHIGDNDKKLMTILIQKGDPSHCKFRRFINTYFDLSGPWYWWKHFDTYKVGCNSLSYSSMHTITKTPFHIDQFAVSGMTNDEKIILSDFVLHLENLRQEYIRTRDETIWKSIICLLPSCYIQTRTVNLNYETLATIYRQRKSHRFKEWRCFCDIIEKFPESWIITGGQEQSS